MIQPAPIIASLDDTTRELSFLGAGMYDHYVPAIVDALIIGGGGIVIVLYLLAPIIVVVATAWTVTARHPVAFLLAFGVLMSVAPGVGVVLGVGVLAVGFLGLVDELRRHELHPALRAAVG